MIPPTPLPIMNVQYTGGVLPIQHNFMAESVTVEGMCAMMLAGWLVYAITTWLLGKIPH
jgi:hypothetical protein